MTLRTRLRSQQRPDFDRLWVRLYRAELSASNPVGRWEPSQNGLLSLSPHRHSVTTSPSTLYLLPCASTISNSPCIMRGPFARGVMSRLPFHYLHVVLESGHSSLRRLMARQRRNDVHPVTEYTKVGGPDMGERALLLIATMVPERCMPTV